MVSIGLTIKENRPLIIPFLTALQIVAYYSVYCIASPTHCKGNILDILHTTCARFIDDLSIIKDKIYCNSDHFPITFKLRLRCKRKKRTKRVCYNYSKANWRDLNTGLFNVDWKSLDSCEPEAAWTKFCEILFSYIDSYVPKFTVKNEYQPPWVDSECYVKCKEKDRLHKKFKDNKSLQNELNFKNCRREFKKNPKCETALNVLIVILLTKSSGPM